MFKITYNVSGMEFTKTVETTLEMCELISETTARYFPWSDPLASWAQITIQVQR